MLPLVSSNQKENNNNLEKIEIPKEKKDYITLFSEIFIPASIVISIIDLILIKSLPWYADVWLGFLGALFYLIYYKKKEKPDIMRYSLANIYEKDVEKIILKDLRRKLGEWVKPEHIEIVFQELTTSEPFKRPVWWVFVKTKFNEVDPIPRDFLIDAYEGFVRRNALSYQFPRVVPAKPIMELEKKPPSFIRKYVEEVESSA